MVHDDSPYLKVEDSDASDHVGCEREIFQEFSNIRASEKKLYVENVQSIDVLGTETYKVDSGSRGTLLLTDHFWHSLLSLI